jgi:hypothetical protein
VPSQVANVIVYTGALVGLGGLGVSLFMAWKGVRWKRAELASSYFKDLGSDPELVFACRALEWTGGLLVVPATLAPLWSGGRQCLEHDPRAMRRAMELGLSRDALGQDERLQIYRTTFDSLLYWMSSLQQAFERNLFDPDDLKIGSYWLDLIGKADFLHPFIAVYHYDEPLAKLRDGYNLAPVDFSAALDGLSDPSAADKLGAGGRPASSKPG